MPRFPAPLDDFEPDELELPFPPSPRRQSRPTTNHSVENAPRRAPSELRPKTVRKRPITNNRLEEEPPVRRVKRPTTSGKSKPKKPARPPRPSWELRAIHYEILGVLCLAFGGLLAYNSLQPKADGLLPQYGIAGLRFAFGIGAIALPFLLCFLGLALFVKRENTNLRAFWRGAGLAFFVLLCGAHLQVPRGLEFLDKPTLWSHGGYIGGALAWVLRRVLGELGAFVALGAFSLIALLLWTETTVGEFGSKVKRHVKDGVQNARQSLDDFKSDWEARRAEKDDETDDEEDDWEDERVLPAEIVEDARQSRVENRPTNRPSPFLPVEDLLEDDTQAQALYAEAEPPVNLEASVEQAEEENKPRIEILDAPPPRSVLEPEHDDSLTPVEALEAIAIATATDGEKPKKPVGIRRTFGGGPPMPEYFDSAVRALDPPVIPDISGVEEDIQQGVTAVQETLAAFKIDARVTDVKRGPVITRYEVQPAPGVRVASIANLDRDLARSLSALAVRIEAPVPGKNVVGIEVPNRRVHLVRMRDVLEQHEFLAHPSKLAFVLGKDIAGQPKWADLTKMPHLLIAGATNSGKSVCLNSLIASIISRATPDEVRFSMIDPKRVELTLYRGVKHLMHDVVVEPKQAVVALRRAIEEMDKRYKMFAARGVRNIVSFNQKLQENEKPLPYIVIVIDELADLMMTAAAEFEKLICRLAQLARATGIHLIVATQRPSVNVITGVIKANIPARIAFAVASQVDSRTILDSVGAERLIGSGDMLFDANNGGKALRIQGAYLSEEEVNRIVDVVKDAYLWEDENAEPLPGFDLYSEEDEDDAPAKPNPDDKRDDLYDGIKEFVLRHQEVSASMIQRKYEIGFPRAGRIVDQLERDGILGPADGPKPRKVLGAGRA